MLIKIIGLGPKLYSKDKFNLFDSFIVILSMVEFVFDNVEMSNSVNTGGAIGAFRSVRLLRVFKLARSWKSF